MATHCNIYLRLKDETKGKTIKFDPTKLPSGKTITNADRLKGKTFHIPKFAKYIRIFCYWDGYVYATGQELFKNYNDYDTILNLLVLGDLEGICENVAPYHNDEKPFVISKSTKVDKYNYDKNVWTRQPMIQPNGEIEGRDALRESYAYLYDFEKGWQTAYCRYESDSDAYIFHDWTNLESEVEKSIIQMEKDLEEERVKREQYAKELQEMEKKLKGQELV